MWSNFSIYLEKFGFKIVLLLAPERNGCMDIELYYDIPRKVFEEGSQFLTFDLGGARKQCFIAKYMLPVYS